MFSLFINPDKTPACVQSKISGAAVSSIRLKRGATISLSVVLLGVTNAKDLKLGVKRKDDYAGELLVLASAASGSTTEDGMMFELSVSVSSEQLNNALKVGSGETEPATLACVSEFSWIEGDDTLRLSDTLTTTVVNDIIRLATEAPDSTAGEYPAADQLATKAWVKQTKASASDYGLVILEADAVIEDEYTAVALTSAGALAIPAATYTKSGGVILGTDKTITGSGVLPVGKTSSGKLAVSASGMTAYALAKENGYTGTEAEWLASLKGEQGVKGDTGRGLFEPVTPQALASETALVNGEIYKISQSELPAVSGVRAVVDIFCEHYGDDERLPGGTMTINGTTIYTSAGENSVSYSYVTDSEAGQKIYSAVIVNHHLVLTSIAYESLAIEFTDAPYPVTVTTVTEGDSQAHAAGTYANLSKLSIGDAVTSAEIWIDCTSDTAPDIVWPSAWMTSGLTLRAHVLNKLRVVNDGTSVRVTSADESGLCIVGQQTVNSGLSNYNCYWWRLSGIYNQGGTLTKLALPTRTSSTNGMSTEPLYLSVWYEDASGSPVCVGRSLNAVTFAINSTLVWEFADVVLPEGRSMRFCPIKASSVAANAAQLWEDYNAIGVQCASRPSGDTVSTVNGQSIGSYTVDCTLYMPLATLSSYVKRSEVAELITNKAALLALLDASSTSADE